LERQSVAATPEVDLNPFDLKGALLAKHAQHVVLIHFPIALFIASLGFDVLAHWRRSRDLATAAYYNLMAAAVATVPAVATGLLAWRWLLEGEKLRGNLRLHLVFGSLSAGMIWLLLWWRTRLQPDPRQRLTAAYFAVALIAVFVVAFTGHLGGILSGVEAPPG
jgi:uncharacterized membrane protein